MWDRTGKFRQTIQRGMISRKCVESRASSMVNTRLIRLYPLLYALASTKALTIRRAIYNSNFYWVITWQGKKTAGIQQRAHFMCIAIELVPRILNLIIILCVGKLATCEWQKIITPLDIDMTCLTTVMRAAKPSLHFRLMTLSVCRIAKMVNQHLPSKNIYHACGSLAVRLFNREEVARANQT